MVRYVNPFQSDDGLLSAPASCSTSIAWHLPRPTTFSVCMVVHERVVFIKIDPGRAKHDETKCKEMLERDLGKM